LQQTGKKTGSLMAINKLKQFFWAAIQKDAVLFLIADNLYNTNITSIL
jgi:hypothetical protein